MASKKTTYNQDDEYYQTASKHRQWNERAYENLDDWEMDKKEIAKLQINLADSYKVPHDEITHQFERIDNDDDDDRDDYLNCMFFMKSYKNPSGRRQIFSIKVKIPEHMKLQANAKKMEELLKNVK
jgi:hypothetical protein